MLRRIFGSRREELTGEWKKLLNEELMICTLHPKFFGDKMDKNEIGGACSAYGEEERRIHDFGGEI